MKNPNPVASLKDYYTALSKRYEDYSNSSIPAVAKFNVNNLNEQRDKLVQKVLAASQVHKNLLLEFATGTGKSNCAIQIIKKHYPDSMPKILLLVAETTHKNNWKKEFQKFDAEKYIEYCTIECYQSAHKVVKNKYDVIIADEAHHLLETELRIEIAKTLKADRLIFLSATLKRKQKLLLQTLHQVHPLKVNLSKAVYKNLLPEFKVITLTLELNNTVKKNLVVVNQFKLKKKGGKEQTDNLKTVEFKDRFLPQHKGTPYKMYLTDKEFYTYKHAIAEMFQKKASRNPSEFMPIYLKKRNELKLFLGSIKTEYAKQLIDKLKADNTRFICYCTSINQAEALSKTETVHSKKAEKENNEIIQKFQNKTIHSIYAVAKLVEGVNLKDIDAGIIIQMDNTERRVVQKLGRTMRSIAPVCYILYFKDTIDVDYVINSLSNIDSQFKVKQHFKEFIKNGKTK